MTEAGVSEATPLSVGSQIREWRLQRGVSTAELALRLKLSEARLLALEADDWGAVGDSTFLRALVLSLGKQFGQDTRGLLAQLPQRDAEPRPHTTRGSLPTEREDGLRALRKPVRGPGAAADVSWGRIALAVLVVALAVVGVVVVSTRLNF